MEFSPYVTTPHSIGFRHGSSKAPLRLRLGILYDLINSMAFRRKYRQKTTFTFLAGRNLHIDVKSSRKPVILIYLTEAGDYKNASLKTSVQFKPFMSTRGNQLLKVYVDECMGRRP